MMANLDESIILLSSMSPKIKTKEKSPTVTKVSKLCLRKYFRQSLDFEKVPQKDEPLLTDDESPDSESTRSDATSKKTSDEVIVIEESEEERTPVKRTPACSALSESRYKIVSKWVEKVNLNMEQFEDVAVPCSDESLFSNVSVICGEKRRSNQKEAVNSTFVGGDKCLRFDQLFSKEDSANDGDEFHKARSKKAADVFDVNGKKQEVPVNKIGQEYSLCNVDVGRYIEKRRAGEVKKILHELCENPRTLTHASPRQTPVQEDHEKLLDELYGHSWRLNKDKVLPKTEPKYKRYPPVHPREPRTEKPPKIHKNPYLDGEIAKSNNLLRSLHSARLRMMLESPLIDKLKELCDSDTNSEGTVENNRKFRGTRLIFDEESDSEKENRDEPAEIESLGDGLKKKLNFDDDPCKKNQNFRPMLNDKNIRQNAKSETSDSDSISSDEWELPRIVQKAKTDVIKRKLPTKKGMTLSFLASLSSNVAASECDASAKLFKECYKNYKVQLSQKLFKLYNEKVFDNVIPENTLLEWNDKLRGTAGTCRCRRTVRSNGNVEYSVSISLSTKVLDSAERLRDTLIHEMCHAATYLENKISEGHGPYWKAWASKAMRVFPELPPIKVCHNYKVNTKYTYKCVSCGYCIGRHSKSLNIERMRCGHCHGKFELLLNKTTKDGVRAVPVTPKKEVTGFALFVKQNYADLKTPERRHKDVMQLLSKKFSAMKTQ